MGNLAEKKPIYRRVKAVTARGIRDPNKKALYIYLPGINMDVHKQVISVGGIVYKELGSKHVHDVVVIWGKPKPGAKVQLIFPYKAETIQPALDAAIAAEKRGENANEVWNQKLGEIDKAQTLEKLPQVVKNWLNSL